MTSSRWRLSCSCLGLVAGAAWIGGACAAASASVGSALATLVSAAGSASVAAAAAGPELGQVFPGPLLGTAVRGRIPTVKDAGTTSVVAFVRTSESASRQAMAALGDLARTRSGTVAVVAFSDEPVSVVRDFANDPSWDERIGFALAADPTRNAFQTVFGRDAFPVLPQVFILKGGVVQWRGAAVDAGPVADEVAAGRWDLGAARRAAEQQRLWDAQMSRIDGLAAGGRHDDALKALDEACRSALPAQSATCSGRRFSLLIGARRVADAIVVGESILRAPANDKQAAGLAWTIANEVPGDKAAMAFALRAAEQSDRALKQRDAMVGAILARVQYLSGDRTSAAATAKRALSVATTPDVRKALAEDVGVYEGKRGGGAGQ
ncbi:MAG: peroxiredoxin family protein [Planctomycetes bacterium]|nr:peroxiredoxin family protein [Planctomycetota bacterium]